MAIAMADTLTYLAWYAFKLSFGLVSLASVWATAVLKNGVLWARDTDEEKQELAAGMCYATAIVVFIVC